MCESKFRRENESGNIAFDFLCDGCPLNAMGFDEAAEAIIEVEAAELAQTKIGRAQNEEKIFINACRRMRRQDECEIVVAE